MKNIKMRYLHWGPYVGSTKLDNHKLERLHEDGKKELESYHKKLAGHVKRQVKYNDETTDWFYKQVSPILDAYRRGHLVYHGLEKREVKKPQGPTPQRKPKSKPTQDEYQMNVRKYRELIKQYIENPNEETLKKIKKLDDIQKNDPYRNEVPLATMKKFENLVEQKDAPSKNELKKYRDEIEELLKIKKDTLMNDKKLFEKFEKLADNKLFQFLPETLTDKLLKKLDIDDDEFKEEPKSTKVAEPSKLDKLKIDLEKFQKALDNTPQPRSAKTAELAEKLIDTRQKLTSKIANLKFSIFEEEGKQKDRDEKERIKKEKKELADFKKAVNDFIKKPTEKLLEEIDNKFELTDDIPESLLKKLEKAIDKFNKS